MFWSHPLGKGWSFNHSVSLLVWDVARRKYQLVCGKFAYYAWKQKRWQNDLVITFFLCLQRLADLSTQKCSFLDLLSCQQSRPSCYKQHHFTQPKMSAGSHPSLLLSSVLSFHFYSFHFYICHFIYQYFPVTRDQLNELYYTVGQDLLPIIYSLYLQFRSIHGWHQPQDVFTFNINYKG